MAVAAFVVSGCSGSNENRTAHFNGLDFDSLVVDTNMMLGQSADAPGCHIRMSIQYAKGKKAQQINSSIIDAGIFAPDYFAIGHEQLEIQLVVDSFVKRYLQDYRREFGEFYRQDPEHSAIYNNEYLLTTHVLNGKKDIIVYLADSYHYAGGAHGTMTTIAKNIDVKTGKVIQLADIIRPECEQQLNKMIQEKMLKYFKAKNIDELHDKGVFEGIDIYAPDNFILDNKKLTFIYVEDEIAPHAIGEIRIDFDYDELGSIIRE